MQYEQSDYQVIPWRNKGKEPCSNLSFITNFRVCKDDA